MPSQALRNFEWNLEDVERLEEAHEQINFEGLGRRALGHITRSALVMLCAAWEVYFEDVVVESVEYIVDNLDDPHQLPSDVKKKIIQHLNRENHELKMFKLAGEGWKEPFCEAVYRASEKLNTPKSEQLGVLCKFHLGIANISAEWSIGPDGVNSIITQRGEIAHRGRDAKYISLPELIESKNKIHLTVIETDYFLATYLKLLANTTSQPWRRKSIPEHLSSYV